MSFPAILKNLGIQKREKGQRLTEPPMPIIVGVGRSGTTLLRLMLDAHPDLAIPPETHFLYRLSKLRTKGERLREDFLEIVLNSHEWDDFHIPEDVFRQSLEDSLLPPPRQGVLVGFVGETVDSDNDMAHRAPRWLRPRRRPRSGCCHEMNSTKHVD